MKLADYIDKKDLQKHINLGLVTARQHKSFPLTVYSYGKAAVFDNIWDDVTCKTRGLIVDNDTDEIIARPFEKFFAAGQHPSTHPLSIRDMDANFGPPIITEKVNGCLGTFFQYNGHWGIATKGSFHSPHAEFAMKWMADHIEEHGPFVYPVGYTPVFEIIAQEVQPHVIKYPGDGLVLLSLINKETGEELPQTDVMDYAERNTLCAPAIFLLTLDGALATDDNIIEGFVATYPIPGQPPFKLKIKFPTFLKNRKLFYEELRAKEAGKDTPKEAEEHVKTKSAEIVKEALTVCTTRKEFADFFTKPDNAFYASVCFAMLDYDAKRQQAKAIDRVARKYADRQSEGSRESVTAQK